MEHTQEGYRSGHPWYYLLGGKRLTLKEIRDCATARGYRGYLAHEIDETDSMAEPRRSQKLRAIRAEVKAELADDVSRYRELARQLARRREAGEDDAFEKTCDDIHTNISLKHNHIYNAFAHLRVLDEMLGKQGDLFGF